MNEKDVLVAARERIADPMNWGKGPRGWRDGDRPIHTCCAAEAIEESARPFLDREARLDAYRALEAAAEIAFQSIVEWNDEPGRTHAEVLAAFDKAIETVSAGHTE